LLLLGAGGFLWLLGGSTPSGPPVGGAWSLTQDGGVRVSDRDFRGRTMLIYFGYTSCPDVCPTTLAAIADALRIVGPRGDAIVPLFITVDPAHDTGPVVRHYARQFDPRFVGLTGRPDEIARIEAQFGIRSRVVDGSIDHTAVLVVVGPDGRTRVALPAEESGAALARRLAGS
jgi:protein SCO1/2